MKISFLNLFIFCSTFCSAQNTLVKTWDYRFGGTYPDEFTAFQQTRDGGFILAGYSNSGANGDKSQPTYGDYDYWIVKLDPNGMRQWDADFGGNDFDELTAVTQTADGGYLLGGCSLSNASGVKSQNNWDATGQTNDMWVVKTDSLGNMQWEKTFGGTEEDKLISLQQTTDGGYILGGFSNSPASGDKSQNIQGANDYWIIKTDALGNKLWDKDFGGLLQDNLRAVRQTSDKGYILGGLSDSPVTGDKTHPTYGVYDFWLIKTDSTGTFLWDKEYGGTDNDYLWWLEITHDNGFIFSGLTSSGQTGNKTSPLWGGTGMDYWAVKTDSLGNVQWQRDLGGTDNEDEFGNLSVGGDGGYVFGGTSYSPVSGDKTENNLGSEQGWFVKIDSLGNTVLDKTIALNSHDENGYAIQTREGCYAFANFNGATVGGLKSQPVQGVFDYWIVRFCDSTMIPVSAIVMVDPICPGTCTNFTNLSINATSFLWSFPGANPSTSTDVNPTGICYNVPGTYDVTLIATSAIGSDTLTLTNFMTVYPYPPPQGIMQAGDTLFANPGAVSYQWYYNGTAIAGGTNYFFVSILNGDYNVVATDLNGCEVEAVIFNVVDVPSMQHESYFEIYPDPVTDDLIIPTSAHQSDAALEIQIYNIPGEKVMDVKLDGSRRNNVTVDVSGLPAGYYFIRINSQRQFLNSRFVKSAMH
jgi:hypothetical protein